MRISSLLIRKAKAEDLKRVYDIERLSFKSPYPLGVLHTYLGLKNSKFLVAEIDSEIVGYIIGVLRRRIIGHIISVAVHPTFRRRGIATKLVEEVERLLKLSGAIVFRLEVRVSNEPARIMYEKLGYKIAYRKTCYYPDGEDAYVMFKVVR